MTKLLVIGLDGATLDLIEPWAKQGLLPNLARLMQAGVYGHLQSVLPVLSSAAWSSFMTGVNPGKHGLYDFVKRAPDGYQLRPVDRSGLREPTLWGLLSQLGKKVCVINVPMTYPPEIVNGIMVTGLGTPDYKTFTYPAELSKTLIERGYIVNHEPFKKENEAKFLEETSIITDKVTETASWLLSEQSWDFFMVVYREPDDLGHFFWHYLDPTHPKYVPDSPLKNAILDYYQKVDDAIGRLVELSGPETNVMLLSDHGTGPLYKVVYLNEWLRQNGWLALQDERHLQTHSRLWLARLGFTRSNVSVILRKFKLGRVERWIKDLLGDKIELLPKTRLAQYPDAIDWSKTKAYSFGYNGQIYINLKGREPQGIVEPGAEFKTLCEQIRQKLLELTDPDDNMPVVDQVFFSDEVFWGSEMKDAPDLIVTMRGLSYITRAGFEFSGTEGLIVSEPAEFLSGGHRMDGVWALSGPDVLPSGHIDSLVRIYDLAPTALHLLGAPVPNYMDGHVVDQWLKSKAPIFTSESDEYSHVGVLQEERNSTEDEEKMLQRLRDLGYLE
jgi:predicted AlkP superfamily phosphohydrolase/phosphomutase